ncbi:mitochondrial ornithine carrier protein [Sporothrix brasiliensis 5110]|uniref:Mitochondrial ornithine carrier protein n=1 Tax=Sporothrix brasiliensis 5110 TaxID=1398154 RepID=A0A0C2IRH2_9PEZI|nr:mitochondrial ornithine carrier protein [Sporothrix brasiliensis 5110]KIH87607.1 mitochondrial ornithine carrier protein [Sporothrix brasiliensis 5110]
MAAADTTTPGHHVLVATEAAPTTSPVKPRAAALEATEDILYGSLAGIVGKYIEYPFDTVKVRLQSQPDHLPLRYTGPLDCFRQSIRTDGVIGMYRGISAPLVGAALETSSLFMFERLGRASLVWAGLSPRDAPLSLPALWFTGAFSGVFTSFILTPVELVKCKIQVPADSLPSAAGSATGTAKTVNRNPLSVIRDVYRYGGLAGFWHGQVGTLIREAGGCASWFGSKETTSKLLREYNIRSAKAKADSTPATLASVATDPLPLWQQAMAGASAGMSYNFLFFPADTVKSRMQTSPLGSSSMVPRTFFGEAKALYRQAGIRGFYRGCGITVVRSAPSSAFIFMVFDGLKTYIPLA